MPQARMEVEAQLRSTNELVAKIGAIADGSAAELDGRQRDQREGRVVARGRQYRRAAGSENRECRCGWCEAIKMIATLRVVDVRQRICGAVIQEMDSEKEKIKVGDRLQVDARQRCEV